MFKISLYFFSLFFINTYSDDIDYDQLKYKNGLLYQKEIIEKFKTRLAGNIGFYEMEVDESFEIDNKLDIEIIKSIMKFKGIINE